VLLCSRYGSVTNQSYFSNRSKNQSLQWRAVQTKGSRERTVYLKANRENDAPPIVTSVTFIISAAVYSAPLRFDSHFDG